MDNETRVALTPQGVEALVKKGLTVNVESGAGKLSNFSVRVPALHPCSCSLVLPSRSSRSQMLRQMADAADCVVRKALDRSPLHGVFLPRKTCSLGESA